MAGEVRAMTMAAAVVIGPTAFEIRFSALSRFIIGLRYSTFADKVAITVPALVDGPAKTLSD